MLEIHERIKQARISAGLTATELAEKIGIKRSTYQYWEETTPSIDKIKKVELALGLHQGYFTDQKIGGVKANLPDTGVLLLIETRSMLRVILGLLAENEAKQTGEMVSSVFSKFERAVLAEMEAKKQELLQ